MEEYKLDAFEKLVVALAGVTEPSERTSIRMNLKSGSAATPTTFQLNGSFTHLVCGSIKDSKTMDVVTKYRKKADRFLRRGEEIPGDGEPQAMEMKAAMDLKIVWKEWVDDCMEVQGSIDTKLYSVFEPKLTFSKRRELVDAILHERRVRVKSMRERMQAAQRLRQNHVDQKSHAFDTSHKADHQDIQRVTKKPKRDLEEFVQQISSEASEPRVLVKATDESTTGSTVDKMSRVRSFIEQVRPPSEAEVAPVVLAEDNVEGGRNEPFEAQAEEEEDDDEEMQLEEDPAAGLYSDIREKSLSSLSFRLDLRDEERNKAAHNALLEHGVTKIVSPNDSTLAHFHILPLGKVDLPDSSNRILGVPVTHLFVERCLFESRVVSLGESFALQPATVSFPLAGANKVMVGLTGFAIEEDVDRNQAEIALRAAGIEVTSTLKKGHHTHLLIGSEAESSKSSLIKRQRAQEWGIHVVGLEFIKTIYGSGKIEPAPRPVDKRQKLIGRESYRSESAGPSLEETQDVCRLMPILGETRPLTVNKQISNAPVNGLRPWQRSASASQALLDGELARGVRNQNSSLLAYGNVESLEAGSLVIKESAKEVMALLNNRNKVSNGVSLERSKSTNSSSNARKRGRLPPSRLRDKRAGSEMTVGEAPSAEDLFAKRRQEEDRIGGVGQTQTAFPGTFTGTQQQLDQSMRITYDDPGSRRERRKLSELIATSVKDTNAQREFDQEHGDGREGSNRSSSTEVEERTSVIPQRRSHSSSISPIKGDAVTKNNFQPSIQARRQPGTCNRI